MTERTSVGGVPFEVTTLENATQQVLRAAIERSPIPVRLSNAYCVALASKDQDYLQLLNADGLNYPDGTPIVWFMRRESQSLSKPGRVRGPSLFQSVLDLGRTPGVKHFFLGTTARTLDLLTDNMQRKYPGLLVAGSYAPEYGPLSDEFFDECCEKIAASNADLVWVALGTPKQDIAAARISARTGRVAVGIGAAFDFSAGTTKEAPLAFQKLGLEWLFRLASEPRRLWRRYLVGNVVFLRTATKSKSASQ